MKYLLYYLVLVLCCMLTFVGCKSNKNNSSINSLPSPVLTKNMGVGVAILADYESDDKIIFHGYFGIFVYDLKSEKVTLAVDLEKTVETNQIQGSPYAKYSGSVIEDISYTSGGQTWKLFENWDFEWAEKYCTL